MKRLMFATVLALSWMFAPSASANWALTYNGGNNDGAGPEFDGLKATTTYYGCSVNANDEINGFVTVKLSRPNQLGQYKVNVTVTHLGISKKITFKGMAQKDDQTGNIGIGDGLGNDLLSKTGNKLWLRARQCVIWGRYDGFYFECARDFAKDGASQNAINVATFMGNYAFSYCLYNPRGPFHGNMAVTASVNAKGVAKVKGVLPDGQKFSYSTHVMVDTLGAYLPIFAQLYSRKMGGFGGFAMDLLTFNNKCNGDGYWDGTGAKSERGGTVYQYQRGSGKVSGNMPTAGEDDIAPYDQQQGGDGVYWTQFNGYTLLENTLPSYKINYLGTKWIAPSNPSALKLSFKAKTGEVTGSFNVMKSDGKKQKLTVHGVYMDNLSMLNAYAKEKGSLGFWIH